MSVDFDGVLHQYKTPWVAPHIIPDPPVDRAIGWLHIIIQKFDVQILTTRARTWRGRRAVRRWLKKHAGPLYYGVDASTRLESPASGYRGIEDVRITAVKGPALIYIDDRAYRFDGQNWPSPRTVHRLKPWHKDTDV